MIKKVTAFAVCALMLTQNIAQAVRLDTVGLSTVKYSNYTPIENVFSIDGDTKQFILLEENEDTSFVLARDIYGTKKFDSDNTQRFDTEDENNIAYFLNNEFKENGNNGKSLPEQIKEYIDYEHVWETESGVSWGKCPEDYSVECGIALLSQTEWQKYIGKFGVKDDITSGTWWLRSPRGINASASSVLLCNISKSGGITAAWDAWGESAIRPCFYLKNDFFSRVKLDSLRMGKNVKKAILDNCSEKELSELYTEDEIKQIKNMQSFGEKIVFEMEKAENNWFRKNEISFTVSITAEGFKNKTYSVDYQLDDKQPNTEDIKISSGGKTHKFLLKDVSDDTHILKVSVRDGETVLRSYEKKFYVMSDYTHQFMEDFTYKGFSTHLGWYDLSSQIEILNRMGIRNVRDGSEWGGQEKVKGKYSMPVTDKWLKAVAKEDYNLVYTLAYNNDLYSGIDPKKVSESTKYGPTSKKEFDGYAALGQYMAKTYKQIDYMQIWNEPFGNGFWKPSKNFADYTYLMQIAYDRIKQIRPDFKISGGCLGASESKEDLREMIEGGGYSYFNNLSYHGYATPQTADERYEELTQPIFELMTREYGGWKTIGISETGWPTHDGASGISEEAQSVELIKQYIMNDRKRLVFDNVYTFWNTGVNPLSKEDNFGVINQSKTPKPAAYTIKNYMQETAGAIYLGKAETNGNLQLHAYLKDGRPLLVAWAKEGSENVDMNCRTVLSDLHGAKIEVDGNVFAVSQEPVYIHGAGAEWINRIIADEAKRQLEETLEYYNEDKEEEWYTLIEEHKEKICAQLDRNAQNSSLLTEAEAEALLREYYNIGKEFIEKCDRENLQKTFSVLFSLHWTGETIANYYAAAVNKNGAENITCEQRLKDMKDRLAREEAQFVGGRYQYVAAMADYAQVYLDYAKGVKKLKESNPIKTGVVNSRNMLAELVIDWIELALQIESPSNEGLLVQLPSRERKFYNFGDNNISFSAYNLGKVDAEFKIRLCDFDGNEIFTTETQNLRAGDDIQIPVSFRLENNSKDGTIYRLQVLIDDEIVRDREITANLENRAAVSLNPVTTKLETLSEVTVSFENKYNTQIKGTIELTPPEGWELAENVKPFTANVQETKEINFTVTSTKQTDFNNYFFGITAKDDEGGILDIKTLPLNFTIATKAEEEINLSSFNGDIESWKDAYPVYVAPPSQCDDPEEWNRSNMSMKAYTLWDSKNMYILFDVYDDAQYNEKFGEAIWNGDCIQISLDSTNDKTRSYSSGDLEIGVAFGEQGEMGYCWFGPSIGTIDDSISKIIRDDRLRRTRYLVKLPKKYLGQMKLMRGYQFGMNLCINDADLISRERFDELTYGTAHSKSPMSYYTWILTE